MSNPTRKKKTSVWLVFSAALVVAIVAGLGISIAFLIPLPPLVILVFIAMLVGSACIAGSLAFVEARKDNMSASDALWKGVKDGLRWLRDLIP